MKLKVVAYQWEIQYAPIKSEQRDTILCWSLDPDNNPHLVRFEQETPYFYINLPEEERGSQINWGKCQRALIDRINWGLNRSRLPSCAHPINFELITRELLCFYEKGKENQLLKLTFNNHNQARKVISMFYYPITISGIPSRGRKLRHKFALCEDKVDIIKRMMARADCGYCEWFEVEASPVKANQKISNLDREFIATQIPQKIPPEISSQWNASPGVFCYDLECYTDSDSHPDHRLTACPIISIACTYKRCLSDNYQIFNLVLGECDPPSGQELRCYSTEPELIQAFLDLIVQLDPEIVTGYNIHGFDNIYLWSRIDLYRPEINIPPQLSRLKKVDPGVHQGWTGNDYTRNKFPGRFDVDVIEFIRKNYNFKINTLDNVSKTILGEGKEDLGYRELYQIYRNYNYYSYRYQVEGKNQAEYQKARQDLTRMLEYGSKDAMITQKVFDRTGIYLFSTEIANVVGVNPEDFFNRGEQYLGMSVIYRLCYQYNLVMNRVRYDTGIDYVGGYVFEPIVGLHDDVACIDFASLYPTIIVAYNICYSTLIKPEDWDKFEPKDYHVVSWSFKDRNYEYRYVKKHIREGILPRLIRVLLKKRYQVKAQIKAEKDPGIKKILDKRQLALKKVANSMYGISGVGYDRAYLPMKPVSTSITTLGRQAILKSARYVEENYQGRVVYGDTDSIMFQIPGKEGRDCLEFGEEIVESLNHEYPDPIRFELEKAGRILCLTKKKYTYWLYEDNPQSPQFGTLLPLEKPGSLLGRGGLDVRRDNCLFQKNLYKDLRKNILPRNSIQSSFQIIKDYIWRLLDHKIPPKELLIGNKMGKAYKNKSIKNNVFRDELRTRGRYLSVGERFNYLMTERKGISLQGKRMILKDEYFEDPERWKIDYVYYFEIIAKKNIDMLWYAGYATKLDSLQKEIDEYRYREIINYLLTLSGLSEEELKEYSDKDDNQEQFEELYQYYKKHRKKDCQSETEWNLVKAIRGTRKEFMGKNSFEIDVKRPTWTLYRSYITGEKKNLLQTFQRLENLLE